MKTILTLLLTCVASFAATTYPVITDNANRQFTGGATNLSLLNGTNVFTGTNTFTAANFFPANGIGYRRLFSTNFFTLSVCNTNASPTNNGDFALCNPFVLATIPALLGSNSIVAATYTVVRSNANTSNGNLYYYLGSGTNYLGANGICLNSVGTSVVNTFTLFQNANSFTNQIQSSLIATPSIAFVKNYVDTSSPWLFYAGFSTTGSHTNLAIYGFTLWEILAP